MMMTIMIISGNYDLISYTDSVVDGSFRRFLLLPISAVGPPYFAALVCGRARDKFAALVCGRARYISAAYIRGQARDDSQGISVQHEPGGERD